MEAYFRKNDPMLLVSQNNTTKSLTIADFNEALINLLLQDESLKNSDFIKILPEKIAAAISEYVDFEEDGVDLQEVIEKIRNFNVLNKTGNSLPVDLSILREDSKNRNLLFRIILKDPLIRKKEDSVRATVADNFRGHEVLDQETSLPNRASFAKNLELAEFYSSAKQVPSAFVYIRLDGYNELENSNRHIILENIVKSLRGGLRFGDAVGRIADDAFGVLLVDIKSSVIRMVTNRLRFSILENLRSNIQDLPEELNLTIIFTEIIGGEDLLNEAQERLQDVAVGSMLPLHETR